MEFKEILSAARNLSPKERGKLVRAIWPQLAEGFDAKTAIAVTFRKREKSVIRGHESIWIELENLTDLDIQLTSITFDTGDENTSRSVPAYDGGPLPPRGTCGFGLLVPNGHNDVLRIIVKGHTMVSGGITSEIIVGYKQSLF